MSLTTERLILCRLSLADSLLYARLTANEDVMRFITGKALAADEAELRFQNALKQTENNPEAGFFIVRSKKEENFVGVAKLILLQDSIAEVGYMLLPESWGKGFASEMLKCMLDLNREKKIASEIIGIVDPENPASIRVLTKFGFELYKTGLIDERAVAYYKLKFLISNKTGKY